MVKYERARMTYIQHLLDFKDRMGVTSDKMADILGLSLKTYQRFIAGESIRNEFDLVMRIYELSGHMMYQMTGAKIPREIENTQVYYMLTEDNKRLVDVILRDIYDEQCRKERE